jgi:AraC family transcriptional regulator
MAYTVTKRDLDEQPVLFVRRRVPPSAIAAAITETLPLIFAFAQKKGIPLNGHPITRYAGMEPGMMSIEPSMRIAGPAAATEGEGEVMLGSLPAGPAAVTTHMGSYDKLGDAYTALQQWIEAQGLRPAGAPWEDYVTDPSEHADPAHWRTDVYWPVA